MMIVLRLFLLLGILGICSSLPMKDKQHNAEHSEDTKNELHEGEDWELNVEYGRYLKEIIQALESDKEFRKKLESADVEDIKSGKIARELHLVDHNVRTKLDELKRRELERLRHLAVQEHEKKVGIDRSKLKVPVHLDYKNPDRFESEDLRKLILQLNKDLEIVDQKRKEEFKNYELEKNYNYHHQLEELPEEQKQKLITEHDEQLKKHKQHPKIHHPGSKQQFEEVWEEQDHMKGEDFDPRTFFHVHDLDGNGVWDENEVKALFQKELDKMYDPNAPESDLTERYEEMERMREHVFGETDLNKDKLISFEEFLEQTKKSDFERDEGWEGLDEQELYSQQEYEQFERQRQQEIKKLIESGAIPPPPGYHGVNVPQQLDLGHEGGVPSTYTGNVPQGYQAVPQGYQAVPQGYQAVPQGYQAVPQGYHAVSQGYQPVPQGYQAAPQGYQAVPQGYQAVPQGYQAVPQGYQAVPQAYQAVPQGYHAVPQGQQAGPQGQQGQQGNNPPIQGQPVPQPPPMPQPQSLPSQQNHAPLAQNVTPQKIAPKAEFVSQGQGISQGQGEPRTSGGGGSVKKAQDTLGQQPPPQQQYQQPVQQPQQYQQPIQQQQYKLPIQQQPGVNQPGSLNQHPEIKPVETNQIPGSK